MMLRLLWSRKAAQTGVILLRTQGRIRRIGLAVRERPGSARQGGLPCRPTENGIGWAKARISGDCHSGPRPAAAKWSTTDEWRRLPSCSSCSSSEQWKSGGRERQRELTPQDDFVAVSHTTNSILFTNAYPFIPWWVRIQSALDQDRVPKAPCEHDAKQEEEIPRGQR